MKFIFGLMANKFLCAFATAFGAVMGIMLSLSVWMPMAEWLSR